jgi:hypothetical protein
MPIWFKQWLTGCFPIGNLNDKDVIVQRLPVTRQPVEAEYLI